MDTGNLLKAAAAGRTPVFCKDNLYLLFSQRHLWDRWPKCGRTDFPTHYRDGSEIPAVAERQKRFARGGYTQVNRPVA